MSTRQYPVTRLGWHRHYAREFNRTGRPAAATLATWHLLLHLALGD